MQNDAKDKQNKKQREREMEREARKNILLFLAD